MPMLHNVKAYAIDSISFRPGLLLAPRFYSFLFQAHDRNLGAVDVAANCMAAPDRAGVARVLPSERYQFRKCESRFGEGDFRRHEIAYLVALCLTPLIGQSLSTFAHAQFLDRYAVPAVIGVSSLFAALAWRATNGSRSVGALVALTFFGFFLLNFGAWFNGLLQHDRWELPVKNMSTLPSGMPIVVTDPIMFLEADYSETPAIASRLDFLTYRPSALQYTGTDVFDRGYYRMRKWFPIHGRIMDYSDFVRSTPVFAVAGPYYNPEDWVLRKLTSDRMDLHVLAQVRYPAAHGEENIFAIVRPSGCRGLRGSDETVSRYPAPVRRSTNHDEVLLRMPLMNLRSIAPNLELDPHGWWTSTGVSKVAYPEEGNSLCFAVEDTSFWFQHRNRCIVKALEQFPPPGVIFDVGGGNGCVARAIGDAGHDVVLVEPGLAGVQNALKRGVRHVVRAAMEDMGAKDETIPAVSLFDVLEHIPDDAGFMARIHRLLMPGGRSVYHCSSVRVVMVSRRCPGRAFPPVHDSNPAPMSRKHGLHGRFRDLLLRISAVTGSPFPRLALPSRNCV